MPGIIVYITNNHIVRPVTWCTTTPPRQACADVEYYVERLVDVGISWRLNPGDLGAIEVENLLAKRDQTAPYVELKSAERSRRAARLTTTVDGYSRLSHDGFQWIAAIAGGRVGELD